MASKMRRRSTGRADYPLTDRVVLITGAAGGLGSATAAALAHRGARVGLADVDVAAVQRLARTLPAGRTVPLGCDVTDIGSVRDAVDHLEATFDDIDVTIANAGILGRGSTFRGLEPHDVDRVMNVNVSGVVNTVSATLESVIGTRGQIVLISSVFAYLNGAGAVPYAMSKAAVEQLGRGLGVELAGHGATVLTAFFSLIDTGMIHRGFDADPHVQALLAAMPKIARARIQPDTAAAAIADAIEARRTSLSVPARWRPVSALRGLVGPITDAALARDDRVRAALARLDH